MQTDEAALGVFERNILRKIYGPIIDSCEYRHRITTNSTNSNIDLVKLITITRQRWLAYVSIMNVEESARKISEDVPEGRRKVGRPRLRCTVSCQTSTQQSSISAENLMEGLIIRNLYPNPWPAQGVADQS